MKYRSRKIVEAVPFEGQSLPGILVRQEGVNNGAPTRYVVGGMYRPIPDGCAWFGTSNVNAGGSVVHPGDMLIVENGKVIDTMPSGAFAASYESLDDIRARTVPPAFEFTVVSIDAEPHVSGDAQQVEAEAIVPQAPPAAPMDESRFPLKVAVATPMSMNAKPGDVPQTRPVVTMAGEKGAGKK